ncbi:VOC family protein [Ureibacillus sp. GCM10028918]|uniref:VOC family protein n=1 Tax=Ureibacillus sp. GCM10028918 TaxID=3273429 RepID=UPI00362084F6
MKINKVTLYAHDLDGMERFYCIKLGFQRLVKSTTGLEIKIGESVLAFKLALPTEQKQYHFAFNIPSNLFKEAKEWIQRHTSLLKDKGQDEVYFESIDAHSFYFYDPEGNVVELIARQSINPIVHADQFTADEILSIGEINLTTDDLLGVGQKLLTLEIPVLNNAKLDETSLNFMGQWNSNAYILLGPAKRNWYFSTKNAVVSRISIVVNDQLHLSIDKNGIFHYQKI